MRRISKRTLLIYGTVAVLLLVAGGAFWYYSSPSADIAMNPPETTDTPCQTPPAEDNKEQEEQITPPQSDEDTTPPPTPPATPPTTDDTQPTPPETPTPAELCRVATTAKQVYFTFDAGSGNQSLDQIVAALDKHAIKATFFVTGRWAESNRAELQRITSRGHAVYNHTYSHPNLTTVTTEQVIQELNSTDNIIRSVTGKSSKPYFRPPFGARNQQVLDTAWRQGYRSVYWSIDTLDWQESATTSSVKKRVMDGVAPGTIYLMHIGSNVTGQVIDDIFTDVTQKGYSPRALPAGI